MFQFYSKRFACEYCEAAYNSEYMLNLHMKQHETDTLCDEQQDTEDTQVSAVIQYRVHDGPQTTWDWHTLWWTNHPLH